MPIIGGKIISSQKPETELEKETEMTKTKVRPKTPREPRLSQAELENLLNNVNNAKSTEGDLTVAQQQLLPRWIRELELYQMRFEEFISLQPNSRPAANCQKLVARIASALSKPFSNGYEI